MVSSRVGDTENADEKSCAQSVNVYALQKSIALLESTFQMKIVKEIKKNVNGLAIEKLLIRFVDLV